MPIYNKYRFRALPAGRPFSDSKGTYLTNFRSDSEIEASNFLAIPYRPLFRYSIKRLLPLKTLLLDYGRGTLRRRIWAAFGKHGGAWEFQSKANFVPPGARAAITDGGRYRFNREYPNGGISDEFATFVPDWDTLHGAISTYTIVAGAIRSGSVRSEISRAEAGNVESMDVKIPEDFPGGVVYWTRGDVEFTVSFLIQKNEKYDVAVRLWGSVWHDEIRSTAIRRHFVEPIVTTVPGIAGIPLDRVLRQEIPQMIRALALRYPVPFPAKPGCAHASNTIIRRLPS